MKLIKTLYRALVLALVVLGTIVSSSFAVARAILLGSPRQAPAIIDLPLGGYPSGAAPGSTDTRMSDGAIALLAHLISLTPGTLSVDVSDDRRVLYVHALFARDPDALRRALDSGLKRRVMELWQ